MGKRKYITNKKKIATMHKIVKREDRRDMLHLSGPIRNITCNYMRILYVYLKNACLENVKKKC